MALGMGMATVTELGVGLKTPRKAMRETAVTAQAEETAATAAAETVGGTVVEKPTGHEKTSQLEGRIQMVDRRGLEPRTLGLRVPCSTN